MTDSSIKRGMCEKDEATSSRVTGEVLSPPVEFSGGAGAAATPAGRTCDGCSEPGFLPRSSSTTRRLRSPFSVSTMTVLRRIDLITAFPTRSLSRKMPWSRVAIISMTAKFRLGSSATTVPMSRRPTSRLASAICSIAACRVLKTGWPPPKRRTNCGPISLYILPRSVALRDPPCLHRRRLRSKTFHGSRFRKPIVDPGKFHSDTQAEVNEKTNQPRINRPKNPHTPPEPPIGAFSERRGQESHSHRSRGCSCCRRREVEFRFGVDWRAHCSSEGLHGSMAHGRVPGARRRVGVTFKPVVETSLQPFQTAGCLILEDIRKEIFAHANFEAFNKTVCSQAGRQESKTNALAFQV